MQPSIERKATPSPAPNDVPDLAVVPPPPRPFRRWRKWVLGLGLLAAAVLSVVLWRAHLQNRIGYQTVMVTRGAIQASITATGTLNPVVDVLVGSQVSGNIKALYADFNSKVTQGQLVAEIDPQIFQAQVNQAQAAVNAAHAAVLTAQAQLQKARSALAGAMAAEKSAEAVKAKDRATALNAQHQFQRQNGLFQAGIVSRQDLDAAKAAQDAATAQVAADRAQQEAARQNVVSAQADIRVAEAQLASARAQQSQAQSALDQARVNLGHTRITAPVTGTVIARNVSVGQTVAASFQAPTIFEIAQDLTKMQVDTNVDESDVAHVAVGQAATFTVDAYPGETFHGRVTAVRKAPINVQNVVTYDVVIGVANPGLKLFPGMTANARILTRQAANTLQLPNAVLRLHPGAAVLARAGLPPPQPDRPVVYVLRKGKPQAVPAAFGISDGKFTAVASTGLHEGDQVVVSFLTSAAAASGSPIPVRRGPGF
jgi:HlyD family secretion protein